VAKGVLNIVAAVCLAAGLAASQMLLGGWWYPALAAPGYLLAGLAAILASFASKGYRDAPGAWCLGSTVLFSLYLIWRQSAAPDPYVAKADTWLLLGALCVYLTAAWHLRGKGPRAILLGVLFFLVVFQSLLAVAQFAAETPFHPWPDLARHMALPRGGAAGFKSGWLAGTFASRTALAGVLEVSSFLALGLLVWGRGGAAMKLLLLWVAAAGFVGLSLSLSRSAYLGVPSGAVAFALLSFFLVRRGALAHRGLLAAGAMLLVSLSLGLAVWAGAESLSVRLRLTELHLDEYRQKLWFITVPPMLSIDAFFGAGANMLDQLSIRYRGAGFSAKPVHAHNDWLQLLVEYGRIGLVLGLAFFVVHVAAGWRNALRLARETPATGLLPQSTTLGLAAGSVAAFVAVGVHAFFDYSLHLPAVALLVALCGGWLAGARFSREMPERSPAPLWLKLLATMPLVPGVLIVISVLREAPAEYGALGSENKLMAGAAEEAWDEAISGLMLRPQNPRLLVLAGEAAGQIGDVSVSYGDKMEWYGRASAYFAEANRERPFFHYAWREKALALDYQKRFSEALPAHLRAIARDPDHARGYEYLAFYFWRQGRTEEARRLFRLAQTLPGSFLASDCLRALDRTGESF